MSAGRAAGLLLLIAALVGAGLWVRQRVAEPGDRGGDAAQADRTQPTDEPRTGEDETVGDLVPDRERQDPTPGGEDDPDASAAEGHGAGGPDQVPATDPAPPDEPSSEATADASRVPPPWAEAVAAEPVPHTALRYHHMDAPSQLLSVGELKRWLAPFAEGGAIGPQGTRRGATAAFDGAFRLRSPWPDQAALRIGAENIRGNRFQIHMFSRLDGVLFTLTPTPRAKWTAYRTSRDNANVLPRHGSLAADDGHRGDRRPRHDDAPLELHWRDGYARLVSGDRTLVAAPLQSPPTDVYFEGRGVLYGLELIRCSSLPPLPPRISSEPAPLGRLSWNTDTLAEGASLTVDADGGATLKVVEAKSEGWAFAPLPWGIGEVRVEVEGRPGVGLYLAAPDGAPTELVRLEPNPQDDNRLSIFASRDRNPNVRTFPPGAPWAIAPRQWVKLLASPTGLQWATGADGVCWATPTPRATSPVSGAVLGIWHAAGATTELRLHAVEMAPLPALQSIATALEQSAMDELRSDPQAPRPPAEDGPQQAAGALARLRLGQPWAADMATLLAGDPSDEVDSLDRRGQLLVESSYLLAGNGQAEQWLRDRLIELAYDAWEQEGAAPFSLLHFTWTQLHPSIGFPSAGYEPLEQLIQLELQSLVSRRQWAQLAETYQRLLFYRHPENTLVSWAGALARGNLPQPAAAGAARWQPIWVDQIDKTTFNAIVELEGLLESESWTAAAKLAATASLHGGLAPLPEDDRLLLGFGDRLRLAAERHRPLRDELLAEVQPVAQLHVRRAMEEGRGELVERHAVRFPLTPAAGDGWRWLGDMALSDGQWPQALACYRRARGDDPYAPDLEAKRQLALSMSGRADPQWKLPTETVAWGEETLSAEQLRQLLDATAGDSSPAPEPSRPRSAEALKAEPQGRIEEPFGRDPRQQVARHVNELEVDWFARQLSWTWAGQQLVLCNRFQLAGFSAEGERLWQAAPEPTPKLTAQRARDLPLTPSQVASDGRHVAARLLYGPDALLCCADAQSGELLWSLPAGADRAWISDPVWHAGRLWALRSATPPGLGDTRLELLQLRIEDGQQLEEFPLGHVRSDWRERRHCQLAPLDRGLVVVLDGAVLRVDPSGVRWVRRHRSLPPETDRRSPLQLIQPPLVSSDWQRVVVQHPGWPQVQCLDAATGAVLWERMAPTLVEVAGERDDRLLVRTDESLEAWRWSDGRTLWRQLWRRRCLSMHTDASGITCLTRAVDKLPVAAWVKPQRSLTVDAEAPSHQLQWRRWSDGGVSDSAPLLNIQAQDPRVGPLLPASDAWWTLVGDGVLDATRTLVRLAPQ